MKSERSNEKLERAKQLLIDVLYDEATTRYEADRLDTIIVKIEVMQHK